MIKRILNVFAMVFQPGLYQVIQELYEIFSKVHTEGISSFIFDNPRQS